MVEGYYSRLDSDLNSHLAVCAQCELLYRQICETLDTASEATLPERGADYGSQVWSRLSSSLPIVNQTQAFPKWKFVPALAALLFGTFVAGMWTQQSLKNVAKSAQSQTAIARNNSPQQFEHPSVELTRRKSPTPNLVDHPLAARVTKTKTTSAVLESPKLSDPEQDAKLLALNSLLEVDPGAALPELQKMIDGHTSDRTKEHTLFVLAQSDSTEAKQALMDIARQTSNVSLQSKAVRMVGLIGDESARKELAGLYATSTNQSLKREILNGLMLSGSRKALLKVARTESDPGLRNSALANLSITVLPRQFPTPSLRNAETGTQTREKKQILNSVFLAADSQVLLDTLRREPDPGLRAATIRSLAVMGERGQVLTDIYRTEDDEKVRFAVLDALVMQQNGDALSELAQFETDAQRRAEILTRLATIRAQKAIR
jgi:hypothetical protein